MAEKMDVDMSLDDIIKVNRGKFSGFRNRGGRTIRGRRGNTRGFSRGRGNLRQAGDVRKFTSPRGSFKSRVKTSFLTTNRIRRGGLNNNTGGGPAKLNISNLDYGVSDSDIKELFGDFGNLRKAVVHYDQSGRSLGTAEVAFERRADAIQAMRQYNNVPLDGRPMKIQITSSVAATSRFNTFTNNFRRRGAAGNRLGGRGRGNNRGRGRGGFNRS